DFKGSFKNGMIRYAQTTQPIENIFLVMNASCPDADYHHAYFRIDTLHATALNDFVDGKAIVHGSVDFPMDLTLNLKADLADISKIYSMDSLVLSGLLKAECSSVGKYRPESRLFPKINANISVRDGRIQTKYYPRALEKINIDLNAQNEQLDLNGL